MRLLFLLGSVSPKIRRRLDLFRLDSLDLLSVDRRLEADDAGNRDADQAVPAGPLVLPLGHRESHLRVSDVVQGFDMIDGFGVKSRFEYSVVDFLALAG